MKIFLGFKRLVLGLFLVLFHQVLFGSSIKIMNGLQYVEGFQRLNNVVKKPKILYMSIGMGCGGTEMHALTLYEHFLKIGYDVRLLLSQNSTFESEVIKKQLPYYATDALRFKLNSKDFRKMLADHLEAICKKEDIDIVHCNKPAEFNVVTKVSNKLGIFSVLNYHCSTVLAHSLFKNCDMLLCANPLVAEQLRGFNEKEKLNIKRIEFIYPSSNEEKFVNFHTNVSREEFFKEKFGIDLEPVPMICTVANFYPCKNHELILYALNKLIYEDNFKVQAVFAGLDAKGREVKLKRLAHELGIEKYVHFLGFTTDIPDIMYYSVAKVLPSKEDAFPICVLEASFLKKPVILSKNAGSAGIIIIDEVTGLLCDPESYKDLASKIRRIIEAPVSAKSFGEKAFNLVVKNFSAKTCLNKFEEIYWDLYKGEAKNL